MAKQDNVSLTAAQNRSNVLPFQARMPAPAKTVATHPPEKSPATLLRYRTVVMNLVLQRAMESLENRQHPPLSRDMSIYLMAFTEMAALDYVSKHPDLDEKAMEIVILQADATANRYLACLNPSPAALRQAQFDFGSIVARRVALLIRYHLAQCSVSEYRFMRNLSRHSMRIAELYFSDIPTDEAPAQLRH